MSTEDEIIWKYAKLYTEALEDEVEFARIILDFNAYDFQSKFLRDRSLLIAADK